VDADGQVVVGGDGEVAMLVGLDGGGKKRSCGGGVACGADGVEPDGGSRDGLLATRNGTSGG